MSKVLKCLETGQLYVYQETGDHDVDVGNLVDMLNNVIDDTVPGSRHDNLRVYAVVYPGDKHEDAGKVVCPVCGSEPEKEEPSPENKVYGVADIKECMLCGKGATLTNTVEGWHVTCQECQMSTRGFSTYSEAIDTWNNKRKVDSFV